MSTALKTDMYEFTMLEAYIHNGIVDNKAVFELFGRKLPNGRQYGVVAGTARAIDAILNFRFNEAELETLATKLNPATIEYLRNYKFTGTIHGYEEGQLWFPYAPLLTIESTLGEGIILETLLLSIFNYDSAVASAASRMRKAAGDLFLMEFGARRVNEDAATVATRATYLAGFNASSNMEAYHVYGVPVTGTAAHAFTLTFPTEEEAFAAQVNTFGVNTTLLVDTYDIEQGVANAIKVAGPDLYAVRIDSGDPFIVIPAVRSQLDSLGAVNTKIVLSGDVTTELIVALREQKIPVDALGVGTDVVTGSGAVACGFVYKLVEVEQNGTMVAVAKKSAGGKKSLGGTKTPYRKIVDDKIVYDVYRIHTDPELEEVGLHVTYVAGGQLVYADALDRIRERHMDILNGTEVPDNVTVRLDDEFYWALNQ